MEYMREGYIAGSILYNALVNTTPELQCGKVTSMCCRDPALTGKEVTGNRN